MQPAADPKTTASSMGRLAGAVSVRTVADVVRHAAGGERGTIVGDDPSSLNPIGVDPVHDMIAHAMRSVDLARNGDDSGKAMGRDHDIENADEDRDAALVLRHHK